MHSVVPCPGCESIETVPLYFGVQALEMVKVVVGFVLVKKGVWIHNIVAPVAAEEESA